MSSYRAVVLEEGRPARLVDVDETARGEGETVVGIGWSSLDDADALTVNGRARPRG